MVEIRTFLFDMDGVIVDSNPVHRESWAQGMYGKRNDMIVRNFLGQHLTDDEVVAHGAAKEALYREMLAPHLARTLVPGLIAFLERHADIPKAAPRTLRRRTLSSCSAKRGLVVSFARR